MSGMSTPGGTLARARVGASTCLLLLLGACAAAPHRAPAPGSAASADYINTQTIDLPRYLAPAPANDSPQTQADIAELLQIQAARTAAQCAQARADVAMSVYRFADALGSPEGFTPERLPKFDALFKHVLSIDQSAMSLAKQAYARPRPFALDSRIEPCVERPMSASYPSGHSMYAFLAAIVLADMVPEKRAPVMARALEYAHNRMVGGVHYGSDVQAGRIAGSVLAALLFDSPAFQRDAAAARAELRQALGLPPQSP
jgi:acid phosphatase (class A)